MPTVPIRACFGQNMQAMLLQKAAVEVLHQRGGAKVWQNGDFYQTLAKNGVSKHCSA